MRAAPAVTHRLAARRRRLVHDARAAGPGVADGDGNGHAEADGDQRDQQPPRHLKRLVVPSLRWSDGKAPPGSTPAVSPPSHSASTA